MRQVVQGIDENERSTKGNWMAEMHLLERMCGFPSRTSRPLDADEGRGLAVAPVLQRLEGVHGLEELPCVLGFTAHDLLEGSFVRSATADLTVGVESSNARAWRQAARGWPGA